jgi:hypothetical protein
LIASFDPTLRLAINFDSLINVEWI